MQLTQAQQRPVHHGLGPALIVAGPGSGKTLVTTCRVARLIQDGVAPGRILLLTFTKKAANEMLDRVASMTDLGRQRVAGGTFHSFAQKQVCKHFQRLGFERQPTIIGMGDAIDIIATVRQDAMQKYSLEDGLPRASELQKVFSKSVNMCLPLEKVIRTIDISPGAVEAALWVIAQYQQQKAQTNVFDFDDMLVLCLRLFKENIALRQAYSMRHEYILVDEYQDTNQLQFELIQALTEAHKNIMVVGDDCQSIYAFRGANIENIFKFTEQFKPVAVYQLTENFRSVPAIVQVVNALIPKLKKKLEKTLLPTLEEGPLLPRIIQYNSPLEQAEGVVTDLIKNHDAGAAWDDMAILYRNSYQANIIEPFLVGHGIPYIKVGGRQITESQHGRDILSILRIRLNPLDLSAWKRVMTLIKGVGPKTVGKILGNAERERQSGEDLAFYIHQYCGKQKWAQEVRDLGAALERIAPAGLPKQAFQQAWAWYGTYFKQKFPADEHAFREMSLGYLQTAASLNTSLDVFLAGLYVDNEDQSEAEQKKGKLTLSTIHSSKGREWPMVYIIDAIDTIHPSLRAESIDEELRVFYVACSRPKFLLTITFPRRRMLGDTWQETVISPFLYDVPYVGAQTLIQQRIKGVRYAGKPQNTTDIFTMSKR